MTCEQLATGEWRLSFSEPEAGFIANILDRLARHYREDTADMPPGVRAYWQGSISRERTADLQEAQEMLADSRAELRSERLALAESWIRKYKNAEYRQPWRVDISSAERDEFVAMLNDRRMSLAMEIGISDAEMEIDPSRISNDARRSAILEIDVLGHFILVTLGPQIYRP